MLHFFLMGVKIFPLSHIRFRLYMCKLGQETGMIFIRRIVLYQMKGQLSALIISSLWLIGGLEVSDCFKMGC